MKILFFHDLNSTKGGIKPTYFKDHEHSVFPRVCLDGVVRSTNRRSEMV